MTIITKVAEYGLITIFSLTIIFHLSVLLGFIPYDIVWGGRLTDQTEMFVFEAVSILINLLFLAIVLVHVNFLNLRISKVLLPIGFWVMSLIFLLNTIGNLHSTTQLETLIFTPITLLLFVFSTVLALKKPRQNK